MAASLNKVILVGNLTRDPDLRALPSGAAVCELGLAVNRRFTNSAGQEQDETCFVDIVVWGRTAENCKQYLEKGSQVLIEGRLQLDQWEDRNGGGKRSKLRVVAESVQFMSRRSDGQGGGGNYGQGDGNYGQGQGGGNYGQQQGGGSYQQQSYGNDGNYGQQQGGGYRQQPQMPRQQPQGNPGGMPAAPRQQQPPMPPMPDNSFNPDQGMEDDIPF